MMSKSPYKFTKIPTQYNPRLKCYLTKAFWRFRILISCYNILLRACAVVNRAGIVAQLKAFGNCLQRPVIYWLKFWKLR